jgi:phosphoglycolate phosphatase
MHICLFDIDGTILLTGGAGMQAFRRTFAEEFGVDPISGDVSFSGRSDRAIAADLFAAHGIDPSLENWERFYTGYIVRVDEELPRHEGTVLPGVEALLVELAFRDDVLIGLLTGNVRETARRKLVHHDLWHRFAFGGYGDQHVDRNLIAAEALAAAVEQAAAVGVQREALGTVLVLGDTLNDIRCARSIGAKVVAVSTGQSSVEVLRQGKPDLLLETLEPTEQILQLLS